VFEEELRLDVEAKTDLLKNCITAFMFVDGVLAGEIYGAAHPNFDEEIPDVDHDDANFIYLYSAALLPCCEGKGLAKILMAFWLGQVNGKYEAVTAHCTHPAMTHLCQTFGAVFFGTHQNWFDSGREATFCKIYLS
jgi:ribosomal protein S18 acetylase RimI-like enzyme